MVAERSIRLKKSALPSEGKAEPGGQALARVRTSFFGGRRSRPHDKGLPP